MSTQLFKGLRLLTTSVAFLCAAHAQAAPIHLSVVSGNNWRSSATEQAGWTDAGFNDQAWDHAYAPYPNPGTTPFDIVEEPTPAQLMWHWPSADVPNGRNGVNQAWFRYTFDLALTPSSRPLIAQAFVIADDEFELFINGKKYDFGGSTALAKHQRPNKQPLPLFADFGSFLQNGTNVFAIHAADGSLLDPRNEYFEYVFFDADIRTVPEPTSPALLFSGLLIMTAMARRVQRRN